MSRFQRMVVIPEEEYRQMMSFKTPLQQQFFDVQQQHEMESLIKDPYSRLMRQGASLETLKLLKENMKQNIATSTPKHFRGRANQLYAAVEPHLDFNERGEILDDSHHPISQSHIEDLIQYAVRDHRRNIPPQGWSYFLNKMKSINVPKMALNRETIKELTSDEMKHEAKDIKHKKGRRSKLPIPTSSIKTEELSPRRRKRKRYSSFIYYN